MRLMIKQRVFAWTDTYDIYDEYGNPKYFVKTEFFNIGHHMHIYDMYDQEIGVIHQEIFHHSSPCHNLLHKPLEFLVFLMQGSLIGDSLGM